MIQSRTIAGNWSRAKITRVVHRRIGLPVKVSLASNGDNGSATRKMLC